MAIYPFWQDPIFVSKMTQPLKKKKAERRITMTTDTLGLFFTYSPAHRSSQTTLRIGEADGVVDALLNVRVERDITPLLPLEPLRLWQG